MFLALLLLTLISGSGFLLYIWGNISSRVLHLLIALGAGSMLSVSLAHILEESIHISEWAIYAFMGGFLCMYLIEEIFSGHQHDHGHGDHSHEDPHEHYGHVAFVSFFAIFVHTLFDGFAIHAGELLSAETGYAVLFGIALHQVPVSLSLAAILKGSGMQKYTQLILLGLFALAGTIGYLFSGLFLGIGNGEISAVIAAFAGGSLLYVATADLLPIIHNQCRGYKIPLVIAFLIGAIGMLGLKAFEGEHHTHADETGNEENHQENGE